MRRTGTFLLLVILILTAFLWCPTPAMASGTINLTPNYGFPGSIVTVTGYGFSGNETGIYLLFDSTPISAGINAINGNWITTVTIPSNATAGPHNVMAIGTLSGTAYAPFNVTSQVAFSINTASGTVGTSVTVSGTGFAASETGIRVLFDETAVVTNRIATAAGAWSASFTVPSTYSGSHIIDSTGGTTLATSVPDLNFTVTPMIALNKASGTAGTSVTVTGTGFAANETGIRVTYDGTAIGSIGRADAKGFWTAAITIPSSSGGDHIIDAYGSSTPADSVSDLSLSAGASISINKNRGAAGTSVTVTGSGFAAGEAGITITFDNTQAGTATASAQGSWTATIVIPESPSGAHAIDAYGPSTQAGSVADVTFTTDGGISITPSSGAAGTSISVSGFGFAAGEKSIVITYDGAVVSSGITANAQGQWTGAFNVPVSSSGAHAVGAYGASTRTASIATASFSIGASISLNKTSGAPGSQITVTGSGFGANEKGIVVTYDGLEVGPANTASPQGQWTSTITVPPSTSGSHMIDAHGTATAAGQVSDLSFNTTAGLSANPTSGNVGTKVTLSGFGFAPNIPLKIKYDNSDLPGVSAGTDASGQLNQTLTIPKSAAGSHIIRVIDPQNNEYKVNFEMESTPPLVPRLLSPEDGSSVGFFKGTAMTFRWGSVSDLSGVTCVLQVNDENSFQQPLLEKSNITANSYTPTSSESLKDRTYYWRVKAIDGAGNESDWSQTWMVHPGSMAVWSLIVITVVVVTAIAAGIIFFLMHRRTRRFAAAEATAAAAAAAAVEPAPFIIPGMQRLDTVQGQWRLLESGVPAKPRSLPFRLALPQAPKPVPSAFSPEEQARLKLLANFAQSLPLAEPTPEAGWLLDLAESSQNTAMTPASRTQMLEGTLSVRYDPVWMRHPLYEDMSVLLREHPVLQELKGFVDAVNLCALESMTMLREIYLDTKAEISPELLKSNDWNFVAAIYSDAMSWYLGKSLQEPLEKDYTSKSDPDNATEKDKLWLWGAESTAFNYALVAAANEDELNSYRGVHIQLRRSYRNGNRSKQIASMITQLEVQRSRLISSFSQFASAVQ